MERKEIIIENPVAIAGVTMTPVIEVSLKHCAAQGSASIFGVKQPIVVILVSTSAKRVFRITGEEISIDQLIQELPHLKKLEGI
jgi:hypothetical protein